MIESEFKFILAIATYDEVYVYSTCSNVPLYVLSGIHYASLTDLGWSPEGLLLAAASMDGYVTFLSFELAEFGQRLTDDGKVIRGP
jgi:chromatin assembly factor 1 subunit B